MPLIARVLETALYFDDLAQATLFYGTLLEREPMLTTPRLVAFDSGQGSVLLLFHRIEAQTPQPTSGGLVPGHTGTGPTHVAFAIEQSEVAAWLERLAFLGIALESRVRWERGGESLYLRDPAGHSVELATRGTWPCY